MRSVTNNNRRATRDIDLDFIHYSIDDEAIRNFIRQLNTSSDVTIDIEGEITELKHQDYHGKSIDVVIRDEYGTTVRSKIDIGVHKHLEIDQEEYCFDVCMDDEGASLFKNTMEQSFVEKLRSLLKFGPNSRRYRDIYDMFYIKDIVEPEKMKDILEILVYNDDGMFENSIDAVMRRVSKAFRDEQYLRRVSTSRQRWLDDDIHNIADGIIAYLEQLKK